MRRPRRLWHLRWIMPTGMLLILMGTSVIWWARISVGQLPILGQSPPFSMTDQNRSPFGSSDIAGQISIFSFGFTRCHSICPTTQKNMSDLYQTYKSSGQVSLITVSVDPDFDTPEILKAYADSWNVTDDSWVFLSAPKEAVFDLCQTGFMLPAENIPEYHTARFVLVDQVGRIRGYYDGLDENSIALLKQHIRLIAQEVKSDAS